MDQTISEKYYITVKTIAIIAEVIGVYRSKIIEKDRVIYSCQTPMQIIKQSCARYFATLNGRSDVIRDMIGPCKRLPITIYPELQIYMIPTCTVEDERNIWIAYTHIDSKIQHGDQTKLVLSNNTTILVATTKKSFDKMYDRTSTIIVQYKKINPYLACPLLTK